MQSGSLKIESENAAKHAAADDRSSCPALCRATTRFLFCGKGVDGRDKPGHDDESARSRLRGTQNTLLLAAFFALVNTSNLGMAA
jgi:hypothetical protein